jgi:hypothetical protein
MYGRDLSAFDGDPVSITRQLVLLLTTGSVAYAEVLLGPKTSGQILWPVVYAIVCLRCLFAQDVNTLWLSLCRSGGFPGICMCHLFSHCWLTSRTSGIYAKDLLLTNGEISCGHF